MEPDRGTVPRLGDRAAARDLLAEAGRAAERLGGDANHRWTAFGPANVALHRAGYPSPLSCGRCHHPAIMAGPGRSRAFACSCGVPACAAPAEHPVPDRWAEAGTSEPGRIAAWWRRRPQDNVGLLTGGAFEVLDVSERLGEAALERPSVRRLAGPVARTGGGRYHFYVTAIGMTNGFVPSQPEAGRSGVFWHGEGGWVIAPPSRHVCGGTCRWLQPLESALPEARLVLRELLDVQDELAHAAVDGAAPVRERARTEPRIGPLRLLPTR